MSKKIPFDIKTLVGKTITIDSRSSLWDIIEQTSKQEQPKESDILLKKDIDYKVENGK